MRGLLLVAIPPYSSGQFPLFVMLPWLTGRMPTPSGRNPTVLIWSVPTAFSFCRGKPQSPFTRSQSHRTHLVSSHTWHNYTPLPFTDRRSRNPTVLIWSVPTQAEGQERGVEIRAVAIPPYSSGQFPRGNHPRHDRSVRRSQSHRTHLVSSHNECSYPTGPPSPGSQSHRTHLVSSHRQRAPCEPLDALQRSQSHRTHLVSSHGENIPSVVRVVNSKYSRNPTVLIWSVPTLRR